MGIQWRFLHQSDSTNSEIVRSLVDNPSEGLTVVADSQTDGRGRRGRSWHSEPGTGIYLSTLIRPNLLPEQLPILTLMAGLATVIAVNDLIPQSAKLKWPNDLLLNGKKIAGILCEYHPSTTKNHAVIIGIGINVNHTYFPSDIKNTATSLKLECGENIDRTSLIKRLITQLDFEYSELKNNRLQGLIDNWTHHTDLLGKTITITQNNQSIIAKAKHLDSIGRLVIEDESGQEIALDSGEVSIREK